MFMRVYFVNDALYRNENESEDKYNCKLSDYYKYKFVITTVKNIRKGKELSLYYKGINYYYFMIKIKNLQILNKNNTYFFGCRIYIVDRLLDLRNNEDFP